MFGSNKLHSLNGLMGPAAAFVVPVLGAVAGSLISRAISKPSSSAAPAAAVEQPKVMPTPDDAAIAAQRKRALSQQLSRSGRQSTILTDTASEEALGGS